MLTISRISFPNGLPPIETVLALLKEETGLPNIKIIDMSDCFSFECEGFTGTNELNINSDQIGFDLIRNTLRPPYLESMLEYVLLKLADNKERLSKLADWVPQKWDQLSFLNKHLNWGIYK